MMLMTLKVLVRLNQNSIFWLSFNIQYIKRKVIVLLDNIRKINSEQISTKSVIICLSLHIHIHIRDTVF